MGTPEFARRPLVTLCESEHEVAAVVTGRPKRRGRGGQTCGTEVHQEADRRNLPVLTPSSLKNKAFQDQIRSLEPDLIVVVAFRILPETLFSIPEFGSINIHGSLLPKYRGAAPINWALINGEKETGLTSFFLKKKVDTGDMILQKKTAITQEDNFDSLYTRLSELSGPFLLKTIDLISQGELSATVQNSSLATPAPKLTPFDALIDFGFPAENVGNFVRGLSTKPGAYTFFRGKKVKILACRAVDSGDTALPPGAVIPERKHLVIQCSDSAIEVTSLLPEGKKAMDGMAFKNGFRPEPGELFGQISNRVKEN